MIIALGLFGVVYLGWWILPYTRFFKKEVEQALEIDPKNRIRIMVANVLITNRHADKLLALVVENDPDILVTLETDTWWEKKLEALGADYPYTIKCPLENTYGMHVFSRYVLIDPKISFLIEADVPSMSARVELPSG